MTVIFVAVIIALAVMCMMQSGTINELSYRVQNQWKMYEKFDEEWVGKTLSAKASYYIRAETRAIQGLYSFWGDVYAYRFSEEFLYDTVKIKFTRDRNGSITEMWNEPENDEDKWRLAINGREMAGVEFYMNDGLFAIGNLMALEDAVLLVRLQQIEEPSPTDQVSNSLSKSRALAVKKLMNTNISLGISSSRRGTISKALAKCVDEDDEDGFFDQI